VTGYFLRRSALSLAFLGALLAAGGAVLLAWGAPLWVPVVLAVLVVGGQYAIAPYVIQWLIPAYEIPYRDGRYDTRS
jgi:hypothetical protein